MKGSVLVIGDNSLAALQVVRSLGSAGLDIDLVCFEPDSVTKWSRFVKRTRHFGHPLVDTERFLESVVATIKRHTYQLVLPTSDKSLVPLMSIAEDIQQHSRFVAPNRIAFDTTQSKDRTVALANHLGIRTPNTVVVHSTDEGPDLSGFTAFPLVVKPSRSITIGRPRQNAVRIVRSADAIYQFLPEMLAICPVLIQEYCPGTGLGLSILAEDGDVWAAFQYRRLHEPPEGGSSTYRKSERLSEELLDGARRFCRAINWSGPAMFEYRALATDGNPVLMEVNGRMWGSLALAIKAGVDFPRLIYDQYVLEKRQPVVGYRVPYFVRNTIPDLYWLQANLRTPANRIDLIKVPLRTVVAELRNLPLGCEGFDVESFSDPLPGFIGWWHLVQRFVRDIKLRASRVWWRQVAGSTVRQMRRSRSSFAQQSRQCGSLLFVCTGNINRSPLAAARLQDVLTLCGHSMRVGSAGFIPQQGRSTSALSHQVARELGVDLSSHRSTSLTEEAVELAGTLVVMEANHLKSIATLSRSALRKTLLLSGFDTQDDSVDIKDPYGGTRDEFRVIYARVIRCVDELARQVIDLDRQKQKA